MTGIYQVYLRYILFQGKRIYPGYTWYILSKSAISRPGLYLVYTRFMPAHLKSCNPSCSISAIGMQRHTGFGLQGCLMFITALAIPTGHRSARAGTGRPRRRGRRCRGVGRAHAAPRPPRPGCRCRRSVRCRGGGSGRGSGRSRRSSLHPSARLSGVVGGSVYV